MQTASRSSPSFATVPAVNPTLGAFIGRQGELAELTRLLVAGHRLMTLVGVAGVGKTRLAKRLADELAAAQGQANQGKVRFCSLVEAADLDGIITAIGHSVGVNMSAAKSIDAGISHIAEYLTVHRIAILLLDNCEHIVSAAAAAVTLILERASEVQIVATSREPLKLSREVVFWVLPLPLPVRDEPPTRSDAVQLFLARVQQSVGGYVIRDIELPTIAELIRRLDGLPLAIELAAARVGVLSPAGILQRIASRFELLRATLRDRDERHHTLQMALDWSWELLQPWERAALAQSVVFRGGFTLEAAEHVIELTPFAESPSVLDVLQALRDKSLLYTDCASDISGTVRFGLYESIRDYAELKLRELGGQTEAMRRHRQYYIGRLGQELPLRRSTALPTLPSSGGEGQPDSWQARIPDRGAASDRSVERFKVLSVELENLLGAHTRALTATDSDAASDAFEALVAIHEVLQRRGPLAALVSLYDATLRDARIANSPRLTARALLNRARALVLVADMTGAAADAHRALLIAQQLTDQQLAVEALTWAGMSARGQGRLDEARAHHQEAEQIARQHGFRHQLGTALAARGLDELEAGRMDDALGCLEEALPILLEYREPSYPLYLASEGRIYQERGEPAAARERLDRAVDFCRRFNIGALWGWVVGYRAFFAHEHGDPREARLLYEEAHRLTADVGLPMVSAYLGAQQGALLADLGEISGAEQALARAEQLSADLASPDALQMTLELSRGHLDLARSQSCTATSDPTGYLAHRRLGKQLLEAASSKVGVRSWDVRLSHRLLARLLNETVAKLPSLSTSARDEPKLPAQAPMDAATLVVSSNGDWFRLPSGKQVVLTRRRPLRLILQSLVCARVESPGTVCSCEKLIHSGWPGERLDQDSGSNRLWVTISMLRKLGLRDVLLGSAAGYLLDPDCPLIIAKS